MYDYLVVGAGLFGSAFSYIANKNKKKVLVLDRRSHIAGNIYTEKIDNINIHKYGAHIFHTNNKKVWNFVNEFAEFNRYTNSPVANYKGEIYSLPFNMYTFNKMWNVVTPFEALSKIEEQKLKYNITNPKNLEEQAISLVGLDIYEKLIKGYTKKQWGTECKDLPSFIIKRLPVRYTYDNNYFNALYQGIPIGGYTKMIDKMLCDIDIILNVDFIKERDNLKNKAKAIIYTGCIDEYYDYRFGNLEYRSVEFKNEKLNIDNYQGNAVVNYTDEKTPFTRIIEHKWFEFGKDENGNDIKGTIISKEHSIWWKRGIEPYYPINNDKNNELYNKYKELSKKETDVYFRGRLGEYQYFDMDKTIESVFLLCDTLNLEY